MKKDPTGRSYWSEVTTPTSPLREPPLEVDRWGPLEIRDKLGHGGFGTVYRAWDASLQREVALKLLAPSGKDATKQRETILREGRLLARIRHQNVATVHGVAEHDGIVGLWMELIRGKSLEELLRTNGPFGFRESIGIGIELCSALRAVHNAGVVHGDVSAKNVIREEGGRLVLVDLGLGGRRPDLASSNTPWNIAGTPAYMAPEMFRGQRPSVTSDVYALGVLLYRLTSGQHPAQAEVQEGEPRERLQTELLRDHRSDIPEAFCGVVERAIALTPADRFQSMGEFQVALERCWTPDRTEASGDHRKTSVWTKVIGLAVIAFLAVIVYLLWPTSPPVPEGSKILLAEIENRTNDAQLDGVTALLRSQLSQVAYFDLLDQSTIREVLQRMAQPPETPLTRSLARQAAWREGIDLVVGGELASLGNTYILNINVEKAFDPESTETTWTNSFRAKDKNAVFDVIDESAAWIREVMGQASTGTGPKTLPSREATTASWEALDSYSRAEELQERGQPDDAVLLFQEAVRIDPDFALAHMRIGDILISLGRHREGYEAWRKALRSVKSRRLTRREELRIAGLYSYDTNNFKEAEKTFRTFSLQYPNDYYPFFLHAFALRAQGRYEEAVQELRQAASRRASLFYIPAQLARTWMLMGQLDLALDQAARLRQMNQPEWALVMEASCLFLKGRFDEAETRFRELIASEDPQWKSEGYGSLAYMLGEQGRSREALKLLDEGIRHDSRHQMPSRRADKLIARAYLAYRLGDPASSRRACLEAVTLEAGPLRLGRAGSLLARTGAITDAQRLLERLNSEMQAPVWKLARYRIQGEILLAQKLYPQAIVSLRDAEQLEPFYSTREYLARALAESGRKTEAFDHYLTIKKSPATFWQVPQGEFPGAWADSLLRCAELAESLNRTAIAKEARDAYRKLRSQSVTQ